MSYFKRPCAVAATYIIDTARILSPAFNQEEIEKTNRIEQIELNKSKEKRKSKKFLMSWNWV